MILRKSEIKKLCDKYNIKFVNAGDGSYRFLIHSKAFIESGWIDTWPEGHYNSFCKFYHNGRRGFVLHSIADIKNTYHNWKEGTLLLITNKDVDEKFNRKALCNYIETFMKDLKKEELKFLTEIKMRRIKQDF